MYGDVIHPVLQKVRSMCTVGGLLLFSINDMLAAAIMTHCVNWLFSHKPISVGSMLVCAH